MKLRDALIQQAPSLTLQRAAADEISRLDSHVLELLRQLETLQAKAAKFKIRRTFDDNTYELPYDEVFGFDCDAASMSENPASIEYYARCEYFDQKYGKYKV